MLFTKAYGKMGCGLAPKIAACLIFAALIV
jgi:hypothetical protein